VLDPGSRANAGFSILHSNRVVKGWPEAWRPPELFGRQLQGSNDLVNQRLTGEIELDAFEVSHTKDDILWRDDEEEDVGYALAEECADLKAAARALRKPKKPITPKRTKDATTELQDQMTRYLLGSDWTTDPWPSIQDRQHFYELLATKARARTPDFTTSINDLTVLGYLLPDAPPESDYVTAEKIPPGSLSIFINMNHPNVKKMGSNVLLIHLQHCAFEALAEWRAQSHSGPVDPRVITFLKDSLFRLISEPGVRTNGHVK
jgi:hypothetical protein